MLLDLSSVLIPLRLLRIPLAWPKPLGTIAVMKERHSNLLDVCPGQIGVSITRRWYGLQPDVVDVVAIDISGETEVALSLVDRTRTARHSSGV